MVCWTDFDVENRNDEKAIVLSFSCMNTFIESARNFERDGACLDFTIENPKM